MPTLEDAILLALQAHRGQVEKDGSPYLLHALRVMLRVQSEPERMAAVLHDVVEDTATTLDDLRQLGYSPEVLAAVEGLTRRSEETYPEFIERAATNAIALRVKIADLEDNMDVRRLIAFSDKDAERMRRYLVAWRWLQGAAPGK